MVQADGDPQLKDVADKLDQEKVQLDQNKGVDGGNAAKTYHTDSIIIKEDEFFTDKTRTVYAIIAWQNADHWGADALFCYKVGHALACNAAVKAGMASSDAEKTKLLNMAYFIDACALHYLTDMFSSGHMRAPRRAFHRDSRGSMAIAGKFEIPVWDVQCRFMHDDDSATGLLCTSANGDSWIAFGDKQFFMPANGPNRARVIYTVQQSVKEVFSYFQKPQDGGQARKVSFTTAFVTLNLIPRVTSSVSTSPNWASTIMSNPAPIWVADQKNDPSKTQPWRYRKQNNNHAAYLLAKGHPGYKSEAILSPDYTPTNEATSISVASFRGEDQFPTTAAVTPQVGFIQLTQTGNTWQDTADYSDWVYLNIWNPVRFKAGTDIPSTTTLRSRSGIEFKKDARATPIVHSLGFFDGTKTATLLLRQQVAGGGGGAQMLQVTASCVELQDPSQGQGNQWDYEAGVPQNSISVSTRWSDKVVLSQKSAADMDLKDLRCFAVSGTAPGQSKLIAVLSDASNVYYGRTNLVDGSNLNGTVAVTAWSLKTSSSDPDWPSRPFLKSWRSAPDTSKRQILFCRHSVVVDNKFKWHAAALQLTGLDGKEDIKWVQTLVEQAGVSLRCPSSDPSYAKVRSSCFLVGDMTGAGKWPISQAGNQCDQVASVTISPTYLQLDVVGWREGGAASSVCAHDCADDLQKGPAGPYRGEGYLRDYILALVPSQFGPGAGLDILHVSLHKANNQYWLKFKTHVNDRSSRNGGLVPGKTDYYGTCTTNWIADTFMSKERYESGRYQSLKWLFIPHAQPANNRNAILEIFSWYGILGMRYFAAKWDGKSYTYSMVGVQPYNGQTSGTIGRGVYETWGEGFMSWGTSEGFADVNYYNMVPGGAVGHGYWDSARQDTAKWNDPGPTGALCVRESDYVRGEAGYVTKLEA